MNSNATASGCPAVVRRYYEQNHVPPDFPKNVSQQYIFYITNTPFSFLFAALVLMLYYSAVSAEKNHKTPFATNGRRIFGPIKLVPFLMFSVLGKCLFYFLDGIKFMRCLGNENICCLAKMDSAKSCAIQGSFRLMLGLSIFLFVLGIAFDAFSIVVRRRRVKIRTYFAVGYGVPLFYAIVAYFGNMSGPTNLVKCWIRKDTQVQKAFIWAAYYVPLVLCWVLGFIFVTAVGRKHRKILENLACSSSTFSGPLPRVSNQTRPNEQFFAMSYYTNVVMVFLAVRVFSLIDMTFRISFAKYGGDAVIMENIMFYTGTLHNFFSPLEGFALALVILSLRPLRQSPLYKKLNLCCGFCCFFWCIPCVYREKAHSTDVGEVAADIVETDISDLDEYMYDSDLSSNASELSSRRSKDSLLQMHDRSLSFTEKLEYEADSSYHELK